MKSLFAVTLVTLVILTLSLQAASIAQFQKPETLETFEWMPRTLVKEPAYKSAKVRYTIWALGDGKKSAMVMVWDESGGTGKGYDTFYFDKNFNGDLTAPEKCVLANGKTFEVASIKEADGDRTFSFKFVPEADNFNWQSSFSMSGPNVGYQLGLLPGNLKIAWSNSLKDAPVYHLGGPAVVRCSGKAPGEPLGKWTAGAMAQVSTDVSLVGDPQAQLRFYHSHPPGGGEPAISLRVQDKSGAIVEDIPFTGGCGCAGSFNKELLIPSRVPPGPQHLVIRVDRAAYVGGPAEFLYPVEIENPDFGKPLIDPAYNALKAKYPGASIASLRRAATAGQDIKGYPEETVVAAQVCDNSLYGPTRDWDMSNANQGGETMLGLGAQIHHKVDARSLIKFDLATLPKDAKVSGAQLRLTLSNQPFTGSKADAKIVAYALHQDWTEAESCWNVFRKDAKWAAPGADDGVKDRGAEPAGSVEIANFPAKDEHYRFVSIALTECVQKWLSGEPNYGVVLKYAGGGSVKICSSEFQDYPFRPTLELAYSGASLKVAAAPAPGEDLEAAKISARKIGKPLMVRFYSPTCVVCKGVQDTTYSDTAVISALKQHYQVVNVNIEDHAKLAQDWGVGGVPTVVLLKSDGETKLAQIESATLRDKAQFLAALAKQ